MPRVIVPVILCGGSGSRLWPVSRQRLPKQFLPLVICNEAHRFLVEDLKRANRWRALR